MVEWSRQTFREVVWNELNKYNCLYKAVEVDFNDYPVSIVTQEGDEAEGRNYCVDFMFYPKYDSLEEIHITSIHLITDAVCRVFENKEMFPSIGSIFVKMFVGKPCLVISIDDVYEELDFDKTYNCVIKL